MSAISLTLRKPKLLYRKQRPEENGAQGIKVNSPGHRMHPRLRRYEELPAWYQDNPHVRTGYRPVSDSFQACIQSLTYLHNESMNIYTHLVPAALLILGLPTVQQLISTHYPTAPISDRLVFTMNVLSALLTFSLSTTYHTVMNHSHPVSSLCLLLDYGGILSLILSSFMSGIYVGFYCEPFLQKVYWSMIISLVLPTCLLVLHARLQGPRYRNERTTAFIATALSGFASIAHGLIKYGWSEMWERSGMPFWLLEGICYGIGATLFATRIPEKLKCEAFDVWGSSHQLFHCFVVLGAGSHLWGVWSAWGAHLRLAEC